MSDRTDLETYYKAVAKTDVKLRPHGGVRRVRGLLYLNRPKNGEIYVVKDGVVVKIDG